MQFIESYEKRMDCKFNRTRETALRNSTHPCHKGTLICGEDLSISFLKKKQVRLNQCWAVGFSILEISKYIMQRLYYKEIVPRLGEGNVTIVMSDTDSFLLEVKGWTVQEVMVKLKDVMDFSNLDKSNPLYDTSRSKAPGYLKNEVPKTLILEVVALRSKTYAIRCLNGDVKNKAKGVVESVKDDIHFSSYLACVKRVTELEVEQNCLRSKSHINQMLRSRKVAFSSFDDKRYLLCAKHSAPYGSRLESKKKRGENCYFCVNPGKLY